MEIQYLPENPFLVPIPIGQSVQWVSERMTLLNWDRHSKNSPDFHRSVPTPAKTQRWNFPTNHLGEPKTPQCDGPSLRLGMALNPVIYCVPDSSQSSIKHRYSSPLYRSNVGFRHRDSGIHSRQRRSDRFNDCRIAIDISVVIQTLPIAE